MLILMVWCLTSVVVGTLPVTFRECTVISVWTCGAAQMRMPMPGYCHLQFEVLIPFCAFKCSKIRRSPFNSYKRKMHPRPEGIRYATALGRPVMESDMMHLATTFGLLASVLRI